MRQEDPTLKALSPAQYQLCMDFFDHGIKLDGASNTLCASWLLREFRGKLAGVLACWTLTKFVYVQTDNAAKLSCLADARLGGKKHCGYRARDYGSVRALARLLHLSREEVTTALKALHKSGLFFVDFVGHRIAPNWTALLAKCKAAFPHEPGHRDAISQLERELDESFDLWRKKDRHGLWPRKRELTGLVHENGLLHGKRVWLLASLLDSLGAKYVQALMVGQVAWLGWLKKKRQVTFADWQWRDLLGISKRVAIYQRRQLIDAGVLRVSQKYHASRLTYAILQTK